MWFIVAESVMSAFFGVARHVGERLTPHEICGSFEEMYKIFFRCVCVCVCTNMEATDMQ